jgi:hypothetical protein
MNFGLHDLHDSGGLLSSIFIRPRWLVYDKVGPQAEGATLAHHAFLAI